MVIKETGDVYPLPPSTEESKTEEEEAAEDEFVVKHFEDNDEETDKDEENWECRGNGMMMEMQQIL